MLTEGIRLDNPQQSQTCFRKRLNIKSTRAAHIAAARDPWLTVEPGQKINSNPELPRLLAEAKRSGDSNLKLIGGQHRR